MPRQKDAIWSFTTPIPNSTTKCCCKFCNQELGASVRTIRSHLSSCALVNNEQDKAAIQAAIAQVKPKSTKEFERKNNSINDIMKLNQNNNQNNNNNNNNINNNIKSKNKQSFMVSGNNYFFHMNEHHQARGDQLLTYCIEKEALPLDLVNKDSFRDFVSFLNPSYKMPKRNALTETHIPNMHKIVNENRDETLTQLGSCTIGLDGSSDGNRNPIEHILATKGVL